MLQDNGELIAALVNVAKEEGRTIATCAEVALQHYLVLAATPAVAPALPQLLPQLVPPRLLAVTILMPAG